jgi:hypothetical protein
VRELTTYRNLEQRLRLRGALPPRPHIFSRYDASLNALIHEPFMCIDYQSSVYLKVAGVLVFESSSNKHSLALFAPS